LASYSVVCADTQRTVARCKNSRRDNGQFAQHAAVINLMIKHHIVLTALLHCEPEKRVTVYIAVTMAILT